MKHCKLFFFFLVSYHIHFTVLPMCRQFQSHCRCSPVIVHTLILSDSAAVQCQNNILQWLTRSSSTIIAGCLVQIQIPLLLTSTFRETNSTLGRPNRQTCWVYIRKHWIGGIIRFNEPRCQNINYTVIGVCFRNICRTPTPRDPAKESMSYWIFRVFWLQYLCWKYLSVCQKQYCWQVYMW